MHTESRLDQVETIAPGPLAALQLARLRWSVAQAPHYARVFGARGLGADSVRALDDLRRFPFTEDRDGYTDRLTAKVEVTPALFRGTPGELLSLQQRIAHALREESPVMPKVELVEPDTLPRRDGKAVRVVDERGESGWRRAWLWMVRTRLGKFACPRPRRTR